jgi:hypothetical protein
MSNKRIINESFDGKCNPCSPVLVNAEQREGDAVLVESVSSGGEYEVPLIDICDSTGGKVGEIQLGEKLVLMAVLDSINYDTVNDEVEITPVLTADDVEIEAEQRGADPAVAVTSVSPGGTFEIPAISIYDEDDLEVEQVLYGETVKVMGPVDSASLVGSQVQIIPSASPGILKPYPIAVQPPSGSTPYLTGDFIDQWNNSLYDFYEYGSTPVQLMKADPSDPYALDASTLNPWSSTVRYTDTDGNAADLPGLRWSAFPSGKEYCVCDWKHRVMWYQPNLGQHNATTGLAQIATNNTAVFKGFDDWFCPPLEVVLNSGYVDPSVAYYHQDNMFLRGQVSGYNEAKMWLARRCELYSTNQMAFYDSYDWRRNGTTGTVSQSIYMCRFIQDTDSFLP